MSSSTTTNPPQRYHHGFTHSGYNFDKPVPECEIISAFEVMGSRVNSLRFSASVKDSVWTSIGQETYKVIKEHCDRNKVYTAISEITLDPMYDEATDEISVRSEIVYHQNWKDRNDPSIPARSTIVTLKGQLASALTMGFKVSEGPFP